MRISHGKHDCREQQEAGNLRRDVKLPVPRPLELQVFLVSEIGYDMLFPA